MKKVKKKKTGTGEHKKETTACTRLRKRLLRDPFNHRSLWGKSPSRGQRIQGEPAAGGGRGCFSPRSSRHARSFPGCSQLRSSRSPLPPSSARAPPSQHSHFPSRGSRPGIQRSGPSSSPCCCSAGGSVPGSGARLSFR